MSRPTETFGSRDLPAPRLAALLERLPRVAIAVVGDFFLDKYLVIEHALSETSLETELEAYQVVEKRHSPGAAGTVTSNLRALGVGTVYALGLSGDDGEGYELRQGLHLSGVSTDYLLRRGDCYTPTYTKPLLREPDRSWHELNRLDVKNRRPLSADAEDALIAALEACVERVDAVMVGDQAQERNCGVVTDRLRARLGELAEASPSKVFFADSRTRIGEYHGVALKPNLAEAAAGVGASWSGDVSDARPDEWGLALSRRAERPVYVTHGERGILLCDAARGDCLVQVAGVRVAGPVDPVGAGDSAAAGIVSALCAGATTEEAALVGNLVASITVQQLGTTGTASPAQVLERLEAAAS